MIRLYLKFLEDLYISLLYSLIQLYVYIYNYMWKHSQHNIRTAMNERTDFFIYLSHFILKRVAKGWCWLCVRGELETERDCYILTPSSSDHSSTSSSFCWVAQPGSWGPKLSVWSWFSLQHLISNWNCNSNSNSNGLQLTPASNWLKLSVAPGYIIVWYPPASCGRTHLHRIQSRPQVKMIFRYLRPDSAVSWLTARSRVNMLHHSPWRILGCAYTICSQCQI